MKKLKYLFISLLLIVSISFAGTTYDQTVSANDTRPGILYYYGTVTFSDSGSGAIYYTQCMYIGSVKGAYGYIHAACSEAGVEDVNVFIEYSNDRTTWVLGTTDPGLDALGTTQKEDTVGIVSGSAEIKYKTYNWMRYKFVSGQAIGSTIKCLVQKTARILFPGLIII
jgi:hypothetical protein